MVLLVVCVVSMVIAAAAWLRVGELYDQIGRVGGSLTDEGELSDKARDLIRKEVRERLAIATSSDRERVAQRH
jgi:hypothetical protein